jgi:hypothetical protein
MTITLQALSLVERVEPVQVRFTLRFRDQRSICECKMDVKSTWIPTWHWMFHGHLVYSQKTPLGGRPSTKPRDHGTPNAHNYWFILFYHVWGPTWIEIYWNGIWLKNQVTYGFTIHLRIRDHTTWFEGVLGQPLNTFFWALTISWSQLLACAWSGPKGNFYTRAWGLLTRGIRIMRLVKKPEIVQVHFTLKAWGIKRIQPIKNRWV